MFLSHPARLVAWFIYDFIEHHSDSDWDRIVHLKLKLRKGKLSAIRRNNSGNFDEQRYQEVWQWKRKNNIGWLACRTEQLFDLVWSCATSC